MGRALSTHTLLQVHVVAFSDLILTAWQSEVSTMGPQVAFFEHRRAVLNVDNNAMKQKMAALVQGQRFKDGE